MTFGPGQPNFVDYELVVTDFVHVRTETANRADWRLSVTGATEPADEGLALADRAEQDGAVRDGLVPRYGDVPGDLRRGLDSHLADCASHEGRERANLCGEVG